MKKIITISREFGSGGRTVAKAVAERMGYSYYDKDLIEKAAEESGLTKDGVVAFCRRNGLTGNRMGKAPDRIVVIKDGKIEDTGTHGRLKDKDGLYAEMWRQYNKAAKWKVGVSNA